jgi:hypothetical protein
MSDNILERQAPVLQLVDRMAVLELTNSRQKAENIELKANNAELKAGLHLDSHNRCQTTNNKMGSIRNLLFSKKKT